MEAVTAAAPPAISPAELVKLAAINDDLYCRTFFPNTFRQPSPPFAKEMSDAFLSPRIRFLNIIAFRGSAKTTRARTFTSKSIAYGESNTILYIGSSEDAALRSIRWIKRQVTSNPLWSGTFGLQKGDKWADNEIEIRHHLLSRPIWILGVGIESTNIRGINFDDYRPDLIVCDDVLQDENSATESQREKMSNLLLGAVKNSLISRVEKPNAKMVLLNTPQHREDFSQQAKSDPEFTTIEVPCWTKPTLDLPVSQQISVWPELYPSEDLRAEKLAALKRNKLSYFAKEKECRLVTSESKAFRPEWLKVNMWKPEAAFCVLGIDPVPPPSDLQKSKGLEGKDYEALYVWGRHGGEYWLMEGRRNRGHEPNWTVNTFFELAYKYRISRAIVEAISYQRTLKWILEQEMRRRKVWYNIVPMVDKRKKSTRIVSVFSGIASQGLVNIGPEDTVFAQQFTDFSEIQDGTDDDLDASAIALSDLITPALERGYGDFESDIEDFPLLQRCP
jgi:phage terminase large subunit-like protein